jgi:hypothetical protein
MNNSISLNNNDILTNTKISELEEGELSDSNLLNQEMLKLIV